MHAYGARFDAHHMKALLADINTRQTRPVWFHLASFLSHVAMISKLVSPISKGPTATARGMALKKELSIGVNSEILPRSARDNYEHFDERIDNWVDANATDILEIVLSDRNGYSYLRGSQKRVRRVILLQEYIYISENRDGSHFELELNPLINEIERIDVAATNWIDTKSPYHFLYPRWDN